MSMAKAKENFELLLRDDEVRVLALSGKWGTGKSHMWRSVRDTSPTAGMRSALYVSLFGLSSVSELKLKLGQMAVPLLEKKGPRMDAVKGALNAGKQALQSIFKLGSAIDELALLSVPALVRDRFIVLDDIERKHDKLTIDEVLGFIDDFTQNYGCRILLILNTDQLADKTVWEKFREKVIDEELRLETTPAEAFDIAIELSPSQFVTHLRPAVEACGLTNIRVIRKIIRTANKVLTNHLNLPDSVLQRVIPSTVLLAAIHYKGIEDGPTKEFVLDSQTSLGRQIARRERERRGEEESDDDKLHAGWALLLERMGIRYTDEYEKLVSEYLDAGLVERSAVDEFIEHYRNDRERADAQSRARDFFQWTMWNPDLTDADILRSAQGLITDVRHLDCYTISSLYDHLVTLNGCQEVAEKMVLDWIHWLRELASAPDATPAQFALDNWAGRPLHPAIVTAFAETRGRLEQSRTLLEVCMYLAHGDGWGSAEEIAMQTATVEDFMQTILNARGEQLKIFLLKNLDLYANRATYERHFGTGPAHFYEACNRIYAESAGTRWSVLIKDIFSSAKLHLAPPVVDA